MAILDKIYWDNNLDVKETLSNLLKLKKHLDSNQLTQNIVPTLYFAYRVTHADVILNHPFSHNILDVFSKYHDKDMLNILIRLLYGAIKAHYFLAPTAFSLKEPQVYVVPDISKPNQFLYQLTYPLNDDSIIIVSQWKSENVSSTQPSFKEANDFPIIITNNNLENIAGNWVELKEKAKIYHSTFKKNIYSSAMIEVDEWDSTEDFPFGTILPDTIDSLWYHYLGAKYAKGIRRYYMEYGWDIDSLNQWIDYIKNENIKKLPCPNTIQWLY